MHLKSDNFGLEIINDKFNNKIEWRRTTLCSLKLVEELMLKFGDRLMTKLPKELSPNRIIDHKIELILRSQSLSNAPYWLNQLELKELKQQLNELLEKGYIRENKSPFGTSILFVNKKNRKMKMYIDY